MSAASISMNPAMPLRMPVSLSRADKAPSPSPKALPGGPYRSPAASLAWETPRTTRAFSRGAMDRIEGAFFFSALAGAVTLLGTFVVQYFL